MRFFALAALAGLFAMGARGIEVCQPTAVYEPCEISFELTEAEATQHPNPYKTVELRAEFRSPKGGRTSVIPGFWDGGGTFRLRFSPMDEGHWDFRIISNLPSVSGKVLGFDATAPRTPGFIRIFNIRYFKYDEVGTPHFWMGDTCYKFATIPWETFTQLIDIRAEQGFTHLRGLVLGFDEHAEKVLADPDQPIVEHFREVDRRVAYMNSKGIVYDLLLAGDQNQLENLLKTRRQREAYVRYLVARYAAYNITWQGVQEFEEYDDGRKLLQEINGYITKMDPYDHPRSTHAVTTSSALAEDKWMNYIVQQSSDVNLAAVEAEIYPMPVINAEFGYEDSGAGKSHQHHIDTDEFRRRLWRAAMNGQYVTFGNTGTYGGRKFDVDLKYANSPGAQQMKIFRDFMLETRYWDMQPHYRVDGGLALTLERPRFDETPEGVEYLVYIEKPGPVEVRVQKRKYDITWLNPIDGTRIDEKDRFNGDRFNGSPPDLTHDWVLRIYRAGRIEGMNKSYILESRRAEMKKIEGVQSEVPYKIQLPDREELAAGQSYEFNATLTKEGRIYEKMHWVWYAEAPGAGPGARVIGTSQFGDFTIPASISRRFPATLQVRLVGVDGVGRVFEYFRPFRLAKE